jgi:AcrR family transcriptional regulator
MADSSGSRIGPRIGAVRGRPRSGVREAIREAAAARVVEEGAGQLSTAEVAARAGTAESSIFYHFKDRVGLLLAVIDSRAPQYDETAALLVERAGVGSLRDNLVALLDALEQFFLRILPMIAAVLADARLRRDFALRGKELDGGPHRAIGLVLPCLSAEQAAGGIRADCDLRAVALLLASAAHQHALGRYVTGERDVRLPGHRDVVALIAPMIET